MRPRTISLTLSAATATGVCASQTATAAGDLTLNGSLVSNGVATLDSNGNAREVIVTSGTDESAKTFTLYGKLLKNGPVVAGTPFTGPTGGAKAAPDHFFSVSRVAVSAALASNVSVGTNTVGSAIPHVPDYHMKPFEIGLQFAASTSGSPNFTVQYTLHSLFDVTAIPVWKDHATMAGMSAAADSSIMTPVTGIRLKNNSGTGTGTLEIVQSGPR